MYKAFRTEFNPGSMFKDSDTFLDIFSELLVFLPLIPVILILWKKLYDQESLNFLMILCLLQFIQHLSFRLDAFPVGAEPAISNLFLLLESAIYFFLFRNHFGGRPRELLHYFAIAFFSSLITYYLVAGLDRDGLSLHLAQFGLIACMISYCMAGLIKRDNLRILQFPIFWIAAGTLFYIITLSLTALTERLFHQEYGAHGVSAGIEKIIIVDMADLARYSFYTIAVWVKIIPSGREIRFPD